MSTINKATESALARVGICEARIRALFFAFEGVMDKITRKTKDEYSMLWVELHKDLNDAYRQLFMWGVINPKVRLKAKEMAYQHYLRKNSEIMHLLNQDGSYTSYSVQEEQNFRQEIDYLKKEIELKDKKKDKKNEGENSKSNQ